MRQTEEARLETPHKPVSQAGFAPIPAKTAESESSRLAQLELENRRLNRLVAELMIKNQQLRDRS